MYHQARVYFYFRTVIGPSFMPILYSILEIFENNVQFKGNVMYTSTLEFIMVLILAIWTYI